MPNRAPAWGVKPFGSYAAEGDDIRFQIDDVNTGLLAVKSDASRVAVIGDNIQQDRLSAASIKTVKT